MKEPEQQAQACVIWMHGLGADASDMAGLAEELLLNEVAIRHVFIDAPRRPVTVNGGMIMPAWFDIIGLSFTDRVDLDGVIQSEAIIRQVMEAQIKDGFKPEQLFLAGFSQGGAMALYTALHTKTPLAGVIALSAFLPVGEETQTSLSKNTPFFIGSGQFDPIILPAWTAYSKDWLIKQGYEQIASHQYAMEHSICLEEIKDLSIWLTARVKEVVQ